MTAAPPDLAALRELAIVSEIDLHFAEALARIAGERDRSVVLALAMASRQVQAGHVCLDLPRLCRNEIALENEDANALQWPALEVWLAALRASPLVGEASSITPLCLDTSGRLYLRRYFEHEQSLLRAISERVARPPPRFDRAVLRAGLDRLFGRATPPAEPTRADSQLQLFAQLSGSKEPADEQRIAAERAVMRWFSVISGGPGTGKTSTVVKILALLIEQAVALAKPAPRIQLLAPTGKAAARLSEAIKRAKSELRCTPEVRNAIADQASTIHRALGAGFATSHRFTRNRDRPLPAEVVIVDEASMVDLALMARLFAAVPKTARLVLLGDKNQLASVEAGAVLGDICGTGLSGKPGGSSIEDSIVHLTRSYRYAPESGIRRLADAINSGEAQQVLDLLRDPAFPDVSLVETAPGSAVPKSLFALATDRFAPFFAAEGALAKLQALDRFRVLCVHRHGAHGQLAISAGIEAALRRSGLIDSSSDHYAGRALIVTANDYQARLFNGDVGVLVHDRDEPDRLRACFLGTDGQPREIAPARLPPHESAYAMSVHKSQGSELNEVAVLLPSDPSPLLSRELLYTAVTRAKERVVLYGSPELITRAVNRSIERASGLGAALWQSP